MAEQTRCAWAGNDPLMVAHHDEEWGVPVHDDRKLFELLILEGAQAGLSWSTILRRREGYRRAFVGFDVERVAAFTEADIERLLQDVGIIRNRQKVVATIAYARGVLELQRELGSFDSFVWSFVPGGQPIVNSFRELRELPAETAESKALSRALKKRGFGFVGPTIMYAFMQTCGLVNDHQVDCFRHPSNA
jgi:DNA-3-methyladenine glycosylase I